MVIIIDKIRLLDPAHEAAFVQWVQEVDYATCVDLPSVRRFEVVRADPGADFDFFEIIHAQSHAAFERDMLSPAFASLVARFSLMATVVETFSGPAVPPGFVRDA